MRKQVKLKTVEQLLEEGWQWTGEDGFGPSNLVNLSLQTNVTSYQTDYLGKWVIVNFLSDGSFEYHGSVFPDGLVVGHSKLEQVINRMRKEIGLKKTELVDDIPLEEQGFVGWDGLGDISVPFEELDI